MASAVAAVVLLVAVLVVMLDKPTSPPQASPVPSQSLTPTTGGPSTPARETAPLTGIPIRPGQRLGHPAVAIKVSDVRQAHPHVGIEHADLVFVEPIGVSYTRLLAVFHSTVPGTVGPVRSMRPMDAPLLSPMAPVFGNTMAARWVVNYIDDVAHVDNLGTLRVSGKGAYVLDGSRPRPDHVFAKPQRLLDLSSFRAAPRPYFSYAVTTATATAAAADGAGSAVSIPYGPSWTVSWSYDAAGRRYLRSEPWGPHRTASGTRVSAANVLVLHAASKVGKIGSGAGAPVPIVQLINASGRFTALAGGHSVSGTWTKAGVGASFVLRTATGEPLRLAPGNTWVELPTPTARVVVR